MYLQKSASIPPRTILEGKGEGEILWKTITFNSPLPLIYSPANLLKALPVADVERRRGELVDRDPGAEDAREVPKEANEFFNFENK